MNSAAKNDEIYIKSDEFSMERFWSANHSGRVRRRALCGLLLGEQDY